MSNEHILSFARSDEAGSVVLAQVTPTGSGAKPLNVKILATEGESVYAISRKSTFSYYTLSPVIPLKHDRIEKLKDKGKTSPEEWEQILTSILLDGEQITDVEAVATISTDDPANLTITIRKRVQGITNRLGAIVLESTEDENLELFDWCSAAIAARATTKTELAAANAKIRELEDREAELMEQNRELAGFRAADDAKVLGGVRDLLNEKKCENRKLQAVITKLRSASVDEGSAAASTRGVKVKDESPSPPPPTRGRGGRGRPRARARAAAATSGRRGAKRKAATVEPEESSDEDFEKMDIDQPPAEDVATASEDQKTTDEDATASEPDDDEPAQASKPASQASRSSKPASRAPPASRNLPARGKAKSPAPMRKIVSAPQGSETESGDEL